MKIKAIPATSENFAAYGRVVNSPTGAPSSQAADYKFWSNIASYHIEGETEIGICTVYQQAQSQCVMVERHMRTPEILIPIDAPFMLPVVKDEAKGTVEAFQVGLGEVVIMNKAVWHGPCLPVGRKECSYFVIFRKNTPHEDVVKQTIPAVEVLSDLD